MDLALITRDGVFSARDARSLGLGPADLNRLARSGSAARIARGWYAAPRPQTRLELHRVRTVAAVRQVEGRAVASHHSALALDGLPVYRADLATVYLTRTTDDHSRARPGLVLRSALRTALPARLTGIPRVHPALAVVQAGTVGHPITALAAADAALRRGLTSHDDLAQALVDLAGSTRIGQIRAVLGWADGAHESVAETRAAYLLRLWGYPTIPQVWVDVPRTGQSYRVDLLVAGTRVVVEVDGAGKYRDREDLVEEKRREDALRDQGYEVVRVTWKGLDEPDTFRLSVEVAVARSARRSA